jgi:hypothetical protein
LARLVGTAGGRFLSSLAFVLIQTSRKSSQVVTKRQTVQLLLAADFYPAFFYASLQLLRKVHEKILQIKFGLTSGKEIFLKSPCGFFSWLGLN